MSIRVAIMQPYFFPYCGYIELARMVDKFVFLDDVNFIKKGWIHKNKVRDRNGIVDIRIPLSGVSQNRLINEINVFEYEIFISKFQKTLNHCYGKVEGYKRVAPEFKLMLEEFKGQTISDFNIHSMEWIFRMCDIECETFKSSEIPRVVNEKGEARIINLCKHFNADIYFNLPGGINIYEENNFRQNSLELKFISRPTKTYQQFNSSDFIDDLSILDYIFFNH